MYISIRIFVSDFKVTKWPMGQIPTIHHPFLMLTVLLNRFHSSIFYQIENVEPNQMTLVQVPITGPFCKARVLFSLAHKMSVCHHAEQKIWLSNIDEEDISPDCLSSKIIVVQCTDTEDITTLANRINVAPSRLYFIQTKSSTKNASSASLDFLLILLSLYMYMASCSKVTLTVISDQQVIFMITMFLESLSYLKASVLSA